MTPQEYRALVTRLENINPVEETIVGQAANAIGSMFGSTPKPGAGGQPNAVTPPTTTGTAPRPPSTTGTGNPIISGLSSLDPAEQAKIVALLQQNVKTLGPKAQGLIVQAQQNQSVGAQGM